jgi:hypothetical protein
VTVFLFVETPRSASAFSGAAARSGSSKKISQAYFHLCTDLNASSGSQAVTIGIFARSATSAPALTSAGVHEPSIATTWSREMSVSVFEAVVLGSVLSSWRMSFTVFF